MNPTGDDLPDPDELLARSRQLIEHLGRLRGVLEDGGFDLPRDPGDTRPELHRRYTPADAVAGFGGPAEWHAGGRFALLPDVVLVFLTRGDPGFTVEAPDRFVWHPGPLEPGAEGETAWLPPAVHDRRTDPWHVFLREPGEERYLAAGRGGIGSWSHGEPGATFHLRRPLPRADWDRFGGYPGWRVWVNGTTADLARDDLAGLDRLLAGVGPEYAELSLTRYEQDVFHAVVNADRGTVSYTAPAGQAGGASARDPAGEPDRPDEPVEFLCGGIPFEVPHGQTVPRALALEAFREFFRTGERPACVRWPEPEPPPPPPPAPAGPRIGFVTEPEWQTGTDPEWLLQSLRRAPAHDWLGGRDLYRPGAPPRNFLDDRKLRLLAVACCRRVWHLLTDGRSRRVVDVCERFADGRATVDELAAAGAEAHAAWAELCRLPPGDESVAARRAAACAAQELGSPEHEAQPGLWAFKIACDVLRETARAVDPDVRSSPERGLQADLVRDLWGNPFRRAEVRPEWRTEAVAALAAGIDADGAFDRLPVLADALEDAGCDAAELLAHLRSAGPHARGCWALDLVLGRPQPGPPGPDAGPPRRPAAEDDVIPF